MKILLRYVLILVVLSMASGCGQHSAWIKGNIELVGGRGLVGPRIFGLVAIGNSEKHAMELPDIFIELPSGEKVLLSSITAIDLERTEGIVQGHLGHGVGGTLYAPLSWAEQTKNFGWGGYSFAVLEDEIIAFRSNLYYIGFWNRDLTKHYKTSITEADAVELFGAPDNIYDFWGH